MSGFQERFSYCIYKEGTQQKIKQTLCTVSLPNSKKQWKMGGGSVVKGLPGKCEDQNFDPQKNHRDARWVW